MCVTQWNVKNSRVCFAWYPSLQSTRLGGRAPRPCLAACATVGMACASVRLRPLPGMIRIFSGSRQCDCEKLCWRGEGSMWDSFGTYLGNCKYGVSLKSLKKLVFFWPTSARQWLSMSCLWYYFWWKATLESSIRLQIEQSLWYRRLIPDFLDRF